jgi:hypothetical protein
MPSVSRLGLVGFSGIRNVCAKAERDAMRGQGQSALTIAAAVSGPMLDPMISKNLRCV